MPYMDAMGMVNGIYRPAPLPFFCLKFQPPRSRMCKKNSGPNTGGFSCVFGKLFIHGPYEQRETNPL